MNKDKYSAKENVRELSLEEMDLLCRKYHHLHDEEVLRICARFFSKVANLFKGHHEQPIHSASR
jgi:hypothetical protein